MAQSTDSGNGRFDRFFWNRYAKCYDNLARHYIPYQSLVQEVCNHIDQYGAGRSLNILVYDTFDSHSHNYVAIDDQGAIIGSIRVTLDNHGLPIEKGYSLNEFREGCILAEMCRLVVRPHYH